MKTCNDSASRFISQQDSQQISQPTWLEQRVISFLRQRLHNCQGHLYLTLPSGHQCEFGSGEPAVRVQLRSFRSLFRLFAGGINGWSEGYIAGEWDSPDLTGLVRWALQNETQLSRIAKASFFTEMLHNLYHRKNHNSRQGSRRNIAAHYDLGNDFYELWLDPSMTYSAALFESDEQPLQSAQGAKYQRILDMLAPQSGDHVVEIGCGWGGFAEHALQQSDIHLHGITLSEEQLRWSRERLAQADLAERADISLTDYRDLLKQYDGVVSIEMFEAVGEEYWDTYFSTLNKCLKPEGTAVLQVISIEDERFERYRKQADFIQRYIFPGGMLPSVSKLEEKFREHGFELVNKHLFGTDYARTLRLWREAFERKTEQLAALGYDETFRRLWRYYLCYCEGGFDQGSIDVGLYQIRRIQ